MQRSGSSDAWEAVADAIQFSIPACIGDFAGLVPTNARVLEVGCGYGRIARELRNHGFTDVTGYDSSPAMIERGHREHPDLTLRLNFGADLPEPDGSADAVVCCAVLTCIPDAMVRKRVLGEIERVLRPGGVVHVVEFAESGGRSYDASGRFKSGLGIEMVHFTRQRLLTELGRFQEIGIREFDCRSISGNPEKALVYQGRKRTNKPLANILAMNESWNLDRKPTAAERGVGIVGVALLFAAGTAALWFSIAFMRSAWVSAVVGAFTAFSAFLLCRFTFASGRKPHRSEIFATAAVFAVAGLGMLIGSFFASGAQEKLTLLSFGISGVSGGILIFSRIMKPPTRRRSQRLSTRDSS